MGEKPVGKNTRGLSVVEVGTKPRSSNRVATTEASKKVGEGKSKLIIRVYNTVWRDDSSDGEVENVWTERIREKKGM